MSVLTQPFLDSITMTFDGIFNPRFYSIKEIIADSESDDSTGSLEFEALGSNVKIKIEEQLDIELVLKKETNYSNSILRIGNILFENSRDLNDDEVNALSSYYEKKYK